MEHHSNIVPWQLICEEKKAKLKVIPINDDGELDLSNIDDLLNTNDFFNKVLRKEEKNLYT